jgi:hypothetical protein
MCLFQNTTKDQTMLCTSTSFMIPFFITIPCPWVFILHYMPLQSTTSPAWPEFYEISDHVPS